MEGVQPALTMDDVVESEQVLKRNPQFQALVAERYGITDMAELAVDPWYSGYRYGHPEGRILQFLLYRRCGHPDDNHYGAARRGVRRATGLARSSTWPALAARLVPAGAVAPAHDLLCLPAHLPACPVPPHAAHPLDTIIFYDFHADRIHDIVSYGVQGEGGRNVPAQNSNFHRAVMERPWRTSLKPFDVVQVGGENVGRGLFEGAGCWETESCREERRGGCEKGLD